MHQQVWSRLLWTQRVLRHCWYILELEISLVDRIAVVTVFEFQMYILTWRAA